MNVLIVEDETVAYENLLAIIHDFDPSIEVIGNTESIRQTIHWIENNQAPDLILMDIHLSDGSAFSIFDAIDIETPIIFTTAYDEHAIEAFKVNSIDYLLKPIKAEELERALKKFSKLTNLDKAKYLQQIEKLAPKRYNDKILVPYRDNLIPVNLRDVSCFYTTDKNTFIFLKQGKQYQYSKTLEQIISTLDPANFSRANKQFIVNRDSVANMTIWFDNRLILTLDIETPEQIFVSKNRASEFKDWLINTR